MITGTPNLLLRILKTIGVIVMMITKAEAAPTFNLKPASYYFADKGTLALLGAAMSGDLRKAKQLVVEGANPNDEGPMENKHRRLRLLHYAIAAKNYEAVKVLLAAGADPELSVIGYGEAFLLIMRLQNLKMMSLFLDLHPVQKISKNTLKSLMFGSVTQPCQGCLELLINRGAPIDFPDGAGYTIMMAAMDTQDYDMAEWLIQKGASVQVETYNGVTPAYSVEFHLKKFIPGSPTYNKVLHLKEMMAERGAVFPALSPEEVRARREKEKASSFPSQGNTPLP